MSKCDLSIELDRQPPLYFPNEEVRGRVTVFSEETCHCADLKMGLQWRTHGLGNRDSGPEIVQSLGECFWTQGISASYPFALTIPTGPVTYHGYLINVDWYVSAKADISWAIDPKVENDIVLRPSPVFVREPAGYRQAAERVVPTHSLGRPSLNRNQRLGVLLGISTLVAFAFGLSGNPTGVGVGLVMLAAGALILFGRKGLNTVAARKLGNVKITVEPDLIYGGVEVVARVSFTCLASCLVNRVWVEVVGGEVAVSGSGTNKTTHRHELGRWGQEVSSRAYLEKGETVSHTAAISIPPGVAPSFVGGQNRVEWRLDVVIDIEGWLDFKETIDLEVQPTPSTNE